MRPVHVALPFLLPKPLTYLAPMEVALGSVVRVSLRSKTMWGVVWQETKQPEGISLKKIGEAHPWIHFSQKMREFLDRVARYTVTPLGSILKMALPSLAYEAMILYEHKNFLGSGPLSFWKKKGSLKTLQSWVQEGILVQTPFSLKLGSMQERLPLILSPTQEIALMQSKQALASKGVLLLEGITGSGKTEVILALCRKVWEAGLQVLILLPEILLSHSWEQRVSHYFEMGSHKEAGRRVTSWHSTLSTKMRQQAMEDILYGDSLFIIGARSALFLPYPRLGMIVVDEEHESGYKQSDGVLYHGRDMAVMRGYQEGIPVILASATPSLESRWNTQHRYAHVKIQERYGLAKLPSFSCIDMGSHPPKKKRWISPPLQKVLQDTLEQGHQSLLFLNRRGYACLLLCGACGYRAACPHCSAWLSVHEKPPNLLCHYCGFSQPVAQFCPECRRDESLIRRGPGIEQIEEEVRTLLPKARITLMSSDHLSSTKAMEETLHRITAREVDVIIGTQLIAKGHHFPYLTSIGIVDTDFALADMDFRAEERLFQMLYQVTGRAGRADLPGHAYLQTFQPQHPLFRYLSTYDWDGFVAAEQERRERESLPPFVRMISITLSDPESFRVQEAALGLRKSYQEIPNVTLLGPAPAPLNPLRGLYRWKFLLKFPRAFKIESFIKQWIHNHPVLKTTKLQLDRDPYSFL